MNKVEDAKNVIIFDKGRFYFYFPFNREINEKIKSIPGYRFDSIKKLWSLPKDSQLHILAMFPDWEHRNFPEIEVEEQKKVLDFRLLKAPFNGNNFFPYQEEVIKTAVCHFSKGNKGYILALDMGLGKTICSLAVAKIISDDNKIVVVCPTSVKDNWLREASYLNLDIQVFSWAKLPDLEAVDDNTILVWDEAHYAQAGKKSQRGEKFLLLSSKAKFNLLLTGTPMKNGQPKNLYPLLKAVDSDLVKSKSWFEKRYCAAYQSRWGWDNTGSSNLDELNERLKSCMTRMRKIDYLPQLPELTRIISSVELTTAQSRDFKTLVKAEFANFNPDSPGAALVQLGKLRKLSSAIKTDFTIELIQSLLDQGESVVVFSEFLDCIERIEAEFADNVCVLTGDTPVKDRQSLVDQFQAGEKKVFVATTRAGGVGLTLTKASYVILHDRPWTPGDVEQAEARIHRIGAKNACTSIWVSHDAVDSKVDALLQGKQSVISTTLDAAPGSLQLESAALETLKLLFSKK